MNTSATDLSSARVSWILLRSKVLDKPTLDSPDITLNRRTRGLF